MHDPQVVVFDIPLPIPRRVRWRERAGSPRWSAGRRRFSDTGGVIDPWWRPRAWQPVAAGRSYQLRKFGTVWHVEPRGEDSGRICKGMGSDLTLHNVLWAWHHRHHLKLQLPWWQRICRRIWTRCEHCKRPFRRGDMVISHNWDGRGPGWRHKQTGVFHEPCSSVISYRHQVDDLSLVIDLYGAVSKVTEADITTLAELRGGSDARNSAWRAFYQLKQRAEKAATAAGGTT